MKHNRTISSGKTRKRSSSRSLYTCFALACICTMFLAVTIGVTSHRTHADNLENSGTRQYISYTVQPGDTLLSISEQFCPDAGKAEQQAYVEEVCRINHLHNCNEIYAGRNLIAYYHTI